MFRMLRKEKGNEIWKQKSRRRGKSCQVSFVIIIFCMAFRMFQLLFLHPPPKLELNSEIGINLLGANFSIFAFSSLFLDVKNKRKRAEICSQGNWIKGQVRVWMVLRWQEKKNNMLLASLAKRKITKRRFDGGIELFPCSWSGELSTSLAFISWPICSVI